MRIYRSLQRPEYAWIMRNPRLLRLWLYLLMKARVFQSSKNWDEHVGCVEVDYTAIKHEVGLKDEEALDCLNELEKGGSVSTKAGMFSEKVVRVVNWTAYQAMI